MRAGRTRGTGSAGALTSAVARARDAWLRGDHAACRDVLAGFETLPGAEAARTQARLLLARALLRTDRPREAVPLLEPILRTLESVDERCTARMLHASGIARSGDSERGIALLADVATDAEQGGAQPAVRAEIAYYRGLAHWSRHEYRPALEQAKLAERWRADVRSVRASMLRGAIAFAEHRYPDALACFRSSFELYRWCQERDAHAAGMIVVHVASLELTLRSASVRGTHAVPSSRRIRGEVFPPTAPSVTGCQLFWLDGWLYALDGDRTSAFRKLRQAEDLAPSDAWRVWALAGRSSLALGFGEPGSAREHAMKAAEIAGTVDWNATLGEERFALLLLAEALAGTEPAAAAEVLAQFDALTSAMDALQFARSDPRKLALDAYVRGLVVRAAGDVPRARRLLEDAVRGFQACGYLWRAALALIELDATPSGSAPRGDFHLEAAALLVRDHFPRSFLARRLGRWSCAYADPVAARLTPALREVLRYALDGRYSKQIAAITGRSPKTIDNQLHALHEAFGVPTTLALVAECHRRGLGSPAWQREPAAKHPTSGVE